MRVLGELTRIRTFAVAFVLIMAVGVTVTVNEPLRPDGSIDSRVSDLIFTVAVPSMVLAWFALTLTFRTLYYRRLESYESRDASQPPVVPTARLYSQGGVLLGLGFELVGQLEYRWPWQQWKMAWVFTNPTYRVDAAICIDRLPSFSSHWADGSTLTTVRGWPTRIVDRPWSRLVLASGPTEAVFARHVQQADQFGQSRGERLPTRSMVEVLAHESAEVPRLRDSMRADWLRPSTVLSFALATGLMVIFILSGLHLI